MVGEGHERWPGHGWASPSDWRLKLYVSGQGGGVVLHYLYSFLLDEELHRMWPSSADITPLLSRTCNDATFTAFPWDCTLHRPATLGLRPKVHIHPRPTLHLPVFSARWTGTP
ncbi:unnamed protein product, partial [Ectocarpus sp. 6 AP-2014]